ncbi:MAG: flagellar assembly protein FliW [Deltaproteobacteria bacterium]|nr:flagellar assembly protein FliW [Deltaproteobacteria bacterium]
MSQLPDTPLANFKTVRFGEIQNSPQQIIRMDRGVLGFEKRKLYTIIERPEDFPFKWLQSLNDPGLAFVIMDPLLFKPDYRIQISSAEAEIIKADDISKCIVFVIISVPTDPSQMTANLLGPIILNTEKRLATQVVLSDQEYSTRHRVIA